MHYITRADISYIATGAAMLGSGGGGNPAPLVPIARYHCDAGHVTVIQPEDLANDDLVVPVACVGAPLIMSERILAGHDCDYLFNALRADYPDRRIIIAPAEIGGSNALTPLILARRTGCYVLDADLLGRAFPHMYMSKPHVLNMDLSALYITDPIGNSGKFHTVTRYHIEAIARNITISMGSAALVACELMSGQQAQQYVVYSSLSRAYALGEAVHNAHTVDNPAHTVLQATTGSILMEGMVTDVMYTIENGFLTGTVTIENNDTCITLAYRNENLIAYNEHTVFATTPDIIIPLDRHTGEPITTEAIMYGVRVTLVRMQPPHVWTTQAGLRLVGPQAFGYPYDYKDVL